MRTLAILTVVLLALAAAILVVKEQSNTSGSQKKTTQKQHPLQDWNETGVAWQTFDAGVRQARAEHKPVCLIFYAEWCPHCRNYGKVFRDPGIIEKSRQFVMIRVDVDEEKEIGNSFQPDGSYVPRTYFLSQGGMSDYSLTASVPPAPQYKYFYDENNPVSLSEGMDRALKKLK